MVYNRFCRRCGEIFKPNSSEGQLCKRCKEILHIKQRVETVTRSLNEIKELLEKLK